MPGGLFGGGGGSGQQQMIPFNAGGTGQGGTVYTPTNQPAFDQQYQQLVSNLTGQAFNVGGGGPAEFSPFASSAAVNIAQNPYAQQQLQGALSTGQYLAGLGQGAEQTAGQYAGIPGNIYGLAGQAAGGVEPTQQLAALAGSGVGLTQQLAGQAAGGVEPTQQLAAQVAGYLPSVRNLAEGVSSLAPGVTTGIAPLQQAAGQVLQTGFDPQSALFNQLRQQSLDASNATASMAGLGSSPYAAENTAEALNNLGINWQNQQLARQAQALQSAGQGYGQAGALAGTAGGLLEGAGGLYGQAGSLGGRAGSLYDAAASQLGQAGSLYGSAAGQAGTAGGLYGAGAGQAGQAAGLYGGVVPAAGQNLQLGTQGANAAMSGYGLPYSTSVGQSQAALPAVQAASNLGLQQMLIPQQILQDLQSYLKLGQSASDISASLGNLGFEQGQQQLSNIGASLSGLGSLVGGATGSNLTGLGGLGAGIGSGISGLGNLFGFGGPTAADFAATTAGLPGVSLATDAAGSVIGTDFSSALALAALA